VVKIKRSHAFIVSTQLAASTFIFDRFSLVALEPSDLKPVSARTAVRITTGGKSLGIIFSTVNALMNPLRSQLIFREPVPNRGLGFSQ
jgi:hypothetical protein